MQTERAEEIIASSDVIAVYYKENPVWLNNVDRAKAAANVRILGYADLESVEVPVAELHETVGAIK